MLDASALSNNIEMSSWLVVRDGPVYCQIRIALARLTNYLETPASPDKCSILKFKAILWW